MNSKDVSPSRLSAGKEIMIKALEKMKDEMIGVVVFAGDAECIIPLTTDYENVHAYLESLETNLIKKQGTDFLKAMQKAFLLLKSTAEDLRKIILISDGEDHENDTEEVVDFAKKNKIKVISIGIGTQDGAPIPEYAFGEIKDYKTDKYGHIVITKRQEKTLKKIAHETGGSYINGNRSTASFELLSEIETLNQSTTKSIKKSTSTLHYYQWSLAVCFLILFIIYLINPKNDLNF